MTPTRKSPTESATMELAGTPILDQLLGHSRRNVLSLGIGIARIKPGAPNKMVATSACISP